MIASPAAFASAIPSAAISTTATAFASAATIPAAATTPASSFFTRTGNIHGQGAALKFLAMKHVDGFLSIRRSGKFDERESAGFAGELVEHEVYGSHDTRLRKVLLQVVFDGLVSEITNEESVLVHD
jgi:hypothetical protein